MLPGQLKELAVVHPAPLGHASLIGFYSCRLRGCSLTTDIAAYAEIFFSVYSLVTAVLLLV